jgi:isochorismate hydrolase
MATPIYDMLNDEPARSPVALLVIDVVNDFDFPEAKQLLEFAVPMAHKVAELKERVQDAGIPVIYVNDNFGRWQVDFESQVEQCRQGPGKMIVELLRPDARDYFVLKPKHSGFYSTSLDVLLEFLGTKTLILTGIAADICVLFTANDAYMRGYIDAALPFMRSQGEGRIVNVASIGGQLAVPHLLPYSASKFALVGLSDGLRAELLREEIYVTTVCPGLMRTGSPRNATFKGQHRAEYAWFSIGSSIPLLTMSAERAAKQIISACRFGQAKVTLSPSAKLAAAANALAPELISDLMGLANKLLPQAGGIGHHAAQGKNSSSWASPSILTALTDRATIRNNEMVAD